MCYHTSQKTTGHEIAKAIQAPFPRQDEFQPIFHANGFEAMASLWFGKSLFFHTPIRGKLWDRNVKWQF